MEPNYIYKKNPDEETYNAVVEAIDANDGYCCCAIEKSDDTRCMCADFKNSTETDFCHCRRYFKVKDCELLALVVDISEDNGADAFQTWFERLGNNDFIVIPVVYNRYSIRHGSEQQIALNKAKIYKADAVMIIDYLPDSDEGFLRDMEEWATDINKKIIYGSMLKNETGKH